MMTLMLVKVGFEAMLSINIPVDQGVVDVH